MHNLMDTIIPALDLENNLRMLIPVFQLLFLTAGRVLVTYVDPLGIPNRKPTNILIILFNNFTYEVFVMTLRCRPPSFLL